MKKTLCKAIYEYDRTLFICLEDIHTVALIDHTIYDNNEWYIFWINTVYGSSFTIKDKNKEHLTSIRNSIIKELEEYYETQKI